MHCRPEQIEALLEGALPPSETAEAAQHLEACARCAREHAWLSAERAVFTQRARREGAPDALWAAIQARSSKSAAAPMPAAALKPGPKPLSKPASEGWRRAALAVAASLLMVATFGPREVQREGAPLPTHGSTSFSASSSSDDEAGFSADPESGIANLEQRYNACLVATPNADIPCGLPVQASFFFSRP